MVRRGALTSHLIFGATGVSPYKRKKRLFVRTDRGDSQFGHVPVMVTLPPSFPRHEAQTASLLSLWGVVTARTVCRCRARLASRAAAAPGAWPGSRPSTAPRPAAR